MAPMIDQKLEIISNKEVSPDTFLMALRSSDIVSQAVPGQFVMIRVASSSDPLLRRPFSICNTREKDVFFILYRIVGRGTSILSEVKKGEHLSVLGPLGRGFDLPKKGKKCILAAGGIGIAPLIFLAQAIGKHDMEFVVGYASVSEMVPIKEVGLTRIDISVATDDGTFGHKGPVTELLEDRMLHQDKGLLRIFACGPMPMLKRVAELTASQKISCQVSLETNMACGLGACQGCAVKAVPQANQTYYHACQDGPVFDIRALDWNYL
jgi:dihydroorotate dehydrogenase electron transfer subunit